MFAGVAHKARHSPSPRRNDWYGKDMVLDNEQAKQLVDYAVKKEVYNWDGVKSVVAEALAHGNKVVINADW